MATSASFNVGATCSRMGAKSYSRSVSVSRFLYISGGWSSDVLLAGPGVERAKWPADFTTGRWGRISPVKARLAVRYATPRVLARDMSAEDDPGVEIRTRKIPTARGTLT
jgi:hypothetical protein